MRMKHDRLSGERDATTDEDFARDIQVASDAYREPLNPPGWDASQTST
jgi:hypothetical protein